MSPACRWGGRCILTVLLLVALDVAGHGQHTTPRSGMLDVMRDDSPPRRVRLTRPGRIAWVHWGATTLRSARSRTIRASLPEDRRAGVGLTVFAWSDGKTAANGSTTSCLRSPSGFRLTAPADTGTRTLTLYVGADHGEGAITAHLSDGSAPDYTDISLTDKEGAIYGVYRLTYRAGAPRQMLIVEWKSTGAYGAGGASVVLQAATLDRTISAKQESRPYRRIKR